MVCLADIRVNTLYKGDNNNNNKDNNNRQGGITWSNQLQIKLLSRHRIMAGYVTRIVKDGQSKLNFDSYLMSEALNISALEGACNN